MSLPWKTLWEMLANPTMEKNSLTVHSVSGTSQLPAIQFSQGAGKGDTITVPML